MNGLLEIVQPGIGTTVQDAGRVGRDQGVEHLPRQNRQVLQEHTTSCSLTARFGRNKQSPAA